MFKFRSNNLSTEKVKYVCMFPHELVDLKAHVTPQSHVSPEEVKDRLQDREMQMLEMRFEGKTLQEIGDEFGLTRERIRQLLNKIYKSPTKEVLDSLDKRYDWKNIKEIFKIYNIKHSEIAKALGCSVTTVPHILNGSSGFVSASNDYHTSKLANGIKFKVLMYAIETVIERTVRVEAALNRITSSLSFNKKEND